jgi:anti-anti-sigma factor
VSQASEECGSNQVSIPTLGSPWVRGWAVQLSDVEIDGQVGVAVAGELDAANSDRLVFALAAVTDGQLRIVLDLGECTFLDSKGLDSILLAASRLHVQGRKLVVCNARGPVRDLLHLTGTESFAGLILSGNWPLDGSGADR